MTEATSGSLRSESWPCQLPDGGKHTYNGDIDQMAARDVIHVGLEWRNKCTHSSEESHKRNRKVVRQVRWEATSRRGEAFGSVGGGPRHAPRVLDSARSMTVPDMHRKCSMVGR